MAACQSGDMTRIVDPRPFVDARLRELADEYEPRIAEVQARLAQAGDRVSARRIKKELRAVEKRYRQQQRRTKAMLGPPVAW